MPNRTAQTIEFGRIGRRVIDANFDGGDLSSDGGLLLLRRTDERIGLTRAVAAVFSDPRDPARIRHRLRSDQPNDFEIQSQKELLKSFSKFANGVTYVGAGMFSIALLVGGAGTRARP